MHPIDDEIFEKNNIKLSEKNGQRTFLKLAKTVDLDQVKIFGTL